MPKGKNDGKCRILMARERFAPNPVLVKAHEELAAAIDSQPSCCCCGQKERYKSLENICKYHDILLTDTSDYGYPRSLCKSFVCESCYCSYTWRCVTCHTFVCKECIAESKCSDCGRPICCFQGKALKKGDAEKWCGDCYYMNHMPLPSALTRWQATYFTEHEKCLRFVRYFNRKHKQNISTAPYDDIDNVTARCLHNKDLIELINTEYHRFVPPKLEGWEMSTEDSTLEETLDFLTSNGYKENSCNDVFEECDSDAYVLVENVEFFRDFDMRMLSDLINSIADFTAPAAKIVETLTADGWVVDEYLIQTIIDNLPKDTPCSYTIVIIDDEECFPSATKYNDFTYHVVKYRSLHAAMLAQGILACGGMYTAAQIFKNNRSITGNESIRSLIPFGDTPLTAT